MRIPTQYKNRVKDAYHDEDGYWIILKKSWRCPDGYAGEKTIHEDRMKDAISILKKTKFTLN